MYQNGNPPYPTGKLAKISEFHPSLPASLLVRDDGTIWNYVDGQPPVQLPISYNQNGKAFVRFPTANGQWGKPLDLWLGALTYKAFLGRTPPNHEVVYLDGNPANVRLDNLAVRAKCGSCDPAFPRWMMPPQEPGTAQNTPPPSNQPHRREEGPPSHRAA